MVVKQGTHLCILQRLKGLSLAGRGISFTQTDQLKEALRDLLLSLQASPGIHSITQLDINDVYTIFAITAVNLVIERQVKVSDRQTR